MKSYQVTDILSVSEGIDLTKETAARYNELHELDIGSHLVVDSNDLLSAIATQKKLYSLINLW